MFLFLILSDTQTATLWEKYVFIIILKLTKTNFIKGGDGGEEKLKETFWKTLAYCSWSEFLKLSFGI